jgi:hypothetical protein
MNRGKIQENSGNGGRAYEGGPEYDQKGENGNDFSNRFRGDAPEHFGKDWNPLQCWLLHAHRLLYPSSITTAVRVESGRSTYTEGSS